MGEQADIYPWKFSRLKLYLFIALAVIAVQLIYQYLDIIFYALGVVNPQLVQQVSMRELITGKSVLYLSNLIVTFLLIGLAEIPRSRSRYRWWHILLLAFACYPGAIAVRVLYLIIFHGFDQEVFQDFQYLSNFAQYPSLMLNLLVYGLIVFWARSREEHENALRTETLLKEARWQMLRYQVNPHFLFNSLNSIMALINRDQGLARKVVNELAAYFRYTLSWNETSVIPLEEEISAVMHFLEIQKIRFEDRLQYQVDTEEALGDLDMPVFGLQTLVENAVKYGLRTHAGKVDIRIEAFSTGELNLVRVKNTGKPWKDPGKNEQAPAGTGSGLANLTARLDLMYPGKSWFDLREEEGWMVAEISIRKGARAKVPGVARSAGNMDGSGIIPRLTAK